jgi:hypothetical protein
LNAEFDRLEGLSNAGAPPYPFSVNASIIYEVRPRTDRKGFALISDELPFGRLWYCEIESAVRYAQFFSRSKDIEIRVYSETGTLIETRKCQGDFVEP